MSDAGPSVADDTRLDPAIWRIAAVAAIGSFMAQLDATVVNVSLSSLAAELHANITTVQWVTSGYLLTLALMLPLNGWLVDRIGAKKLYLGCFVAFTLSSTLCGLAWSAGSLIGFRILQGISGGLLAPMAQMMIARAAGKRFARVVGFVAVPVLLAPLLGPVIAGAILQFASWRWLFLINLPVGALALALASAFLPSDAGETRPRSLDFIGLALLSPGLVLFLYSSDHLDNRFGWASIAAALVLLALFAISAWKKGDAALIDLRLLTRKAFSTSLTTMFLTNGVAFAGQMLVPIYLIRQCGLSPSETGWLMAPLGLGMMCTYPFIGALTDRFGIRHLVACGAVLALVGVAPLVYMAAHGMNFMLFVAALFVRGVGMSTIGVPSISSAYAAVAKQDLPMATGAMNIVQRLGGPTLTTVVATFLGWRTGLASSPSPLSSAFAASFVLLCGLHILLFLAALRLPVNIDRQPIQAKP
ncbi:DHA2 family efflux MFS transporter permease subunit [Lichenifustis flavocetrariae]|uniref:DHA2 family efflux MFS transporter permease subunit n=1 Tax=Lichenifustis flavocetrariae TaxID=2949735 RepID=A0AA41Z020_9HYPH|nr:DHA2 family efflux MFS transporter permease subunit [Lichenifustis flavocetrariae]MCW6510380.1 DHA2 family efflux MFS transporter permease subunit [Lichenifustis flavocetrariae]